MTSTLTDPGEVQPRRSMVDVAARWQAHLPKLSNVCCTTDDDRRGHIMAYTDARWVTMPNDDERWRTHTITTPRTRAIV